MLSTRFYSWTLLAASGFALVLASQATMARQPNKDDLPKPFPNILAFRDNPADLKKAKEAFTTFAKYQADYISHPKVYSTPQEFSPIPGKVQTSDQIIVDMSRFILVPLPGNQIGPDQADYIRELGLALDTELKIAIEQNGTAVVRVNATRLLAAACRSGATAHFSTVTSLITNANTPAEVKYYAFQAAANLLAAYDLNDYPTRKHANKPKEVSDLIAALQAAITKPNAIIPAPGTGGPLPLDQVEVLTFIRRQAVRALAQVRFGEKIAGGPDLHPAFTLAQIAISDPAIVPPPTETEVAEAVIGICNMAPPTRAADKEPYAYAMADAVATGIATFATRRAAAPLDKSLSWRNYGARISDGLKSWRPLFDPVYNPLKPTAFSAASVPKIVDDLQAEADKRVLVPMFEANGTVDVNGLKQFRDNTLRNDKKWTLSPFLAEPKLTLPKR